MTLHDSDGFLKAKSGMTALDSFLFEARGGFRSSMLHSKPMSEKNRILLKFIKNNPNCTHMACTAALGGVRSGALTDFVGIGYLDGPEKSSRLATYKITQKGLYAMDRVINNSNRLAEIKAHIGEFESYVDRTIYSLRPGAMDAKKYKSLGTT